MKTKTIVPLILGLILLIATPAAAQDSDGHEGHQMGEQIRETTIDDHQLSYRLIDMREQMKGETGKTTTHHLMVTITGPDGQPVKGATVGFLVKGPDGTDQKAMAMTMGDSYGADVYLGDPGTYTIRSKAVFGDKKLIDGFNYEMQ